MWEGLRGVKGLRSFWPDRWKGRVVVCCLLRRKLKEDVLGGRRLRCGQDETLLGGLGQRGDRRVDVQWSLFNAQFAQSGES